MALTISEANAVNHLLYHLLAGSGPGEDAAREAAILLAESACKRLLTGITGKEVAELWAARAAEVSPHHDHDDQDVRRLTLTLAETGPDGSIVVQIWDICPCNRTWIRGQLGEPSVESFSTREQVEATADVIRQIPTVRIGEEF